MRLLLPLVLALLGCQSKARCLAAEAGLRLNLELATLADLARSGDAQAFETQRAVVEASARTFKETSSGDEALEHAKRKYLEGVPARFTDWRERMTASPRGNPDDDSGWIIMKNTAASEFTCDSK